MRKNGRVTTIIFDWGGVMCSGADIFGKLKDETGLSLKEIKKRSDVLVRDFYSGEIKTKDFWNKYTAIFDLNDSLKETLSRNYLNSYYIYPEMFKMILDLRSKYKIGLLSNLNHQMKRHILKKHKLDKYFHYLVFSCDIGSLKPDKSAFKNMLDKVKAKSSNAVFIDDSKANIETAKKLGFQTLLFLSGSQCRAELKTYLK
jgi:epoxide hydrolase-like predicted phosphatase